MTTQDDVRRLALALPETTGHPDRFEFRVRDKAFAWVYPERVHPKRARVPNPEAIVLRVANLDEKEVMLAANPAAFFTTDHYNGYPAIIVWLPKIDVDELEDLLTDAWHCQAPKSLAEQFDANRMSNDPGRA
jgi:hypothetical protein